MTEMSAEEIAQIYIEQVEVPRELPTQRVHLVTVGLVGAGKTTVLKKIQAFIPFARVSGDEIRKVIKDRGADLELTWQVGKIVSEHFADLGHNIGHDTDGVLLKTRQSIETNAKQQGAAVVYLHVNPPEEFILTKLRNYNHTWLFKDADAAIATYQRRKPLHEDLSEIHFTYTYDTSSPNLDEQVSDSIPVIQNEIVKQLS